ncbi:MAG: hypothetical protein AAF497_21950, partial [Planctomycetota bacterium]
MSDAGAINESGMGVEDAGATSPFAAPVAPRNKFEGLLDRFSDWINPILVKESRQALKSRQFLFTFQLLLLASWVWSLLGIALRSPGIFYVPGGRFMLIGYFLILNLPLMIIIPFAAFRSLAAEREDGTYELLSISTLKPRQIIGGKLGSSLLQIIIYLSVLAPCMAFTYLLKGVDILLVLSVVFWTGLSSWLLCTLGLLLATLTRERHWQIVLSVMFILFLGVLCLYSSIGYSVMIGQSVAIPFNEPEFWVGVLCTLTGVFSVATLSLLSASARITNRSENRSTPLRIAVLTVHILGAVWAARYALKFPEDSEAPMFVYLVLASLFCALVGGMMTGEDSLLSPRARRGLPKTQLGRILLTLFFPGPGTGYLFTVAMAIMVTMVVGGIALITSPLRGGVALTGNHEEAFNGAWVLSAYIVIYVGLNRLLLRRLAKTTLVGPMLGVVSLVILVMIGTIFPLIIQFSLQHYMLGGDDYTLMQLPNVFWTTVEVVDGDLRGGMVAFGIPGVNGACLLLSGVAAFVFLLNLLTLSKSLVVTRTATPERVKQDDA